MIDGSLPLDGRPRRILEVIGLLVLVVLVGAVATAAVPQLAGADHSYVVKSDSMAPAIPAGSMVYVDEVPATEITVEDVITYRDVAGGESRRVTHRVVEVVETDSGRAFRTQGDANPAPDSNLVSPDAVVGAVTFHVPLLGWLVAFVGSSVGIVALVVIPALLLAALELRDLLSEDGGQE